MAMVELEFNHPQYSDEQLCVSISRILNNNVLFSMASIRTSYGHPESWINTAYYCFSNSMEFYFLSPPSTQHCQNIETLSSVALNIFDSHQIEGGKQGLQIFGECQRAAGSKVQEGLHLYVERFPGLGTVIKTPEDFDKNIMESKLYIVRTYRVKVFDEPSFGEENWITLDIEGI